MGVIDTFEVPENVAGYLDWPSGTLFVNRTYEEWQEFLSGTNAEPFARDRTILDHTITHETYHFYQIATTGYLYQYASRLLAAIVDIVGFPVGETNMNKLVDDLPEPSPSLRGVLEEIDDPGPEGLTVRAIVESAAYLYEYKAHYPRFGLRSFKEQIVMEDLPKEYSHAFEIAEIALGDAAFDNFLIVALLALCFEDPTSAFYTALDAVRRTGTIYRRPEDLPSLLGASEQISKAHSGLGSAAQVAFEHPDNIPRQNPIFRKATYDLNVNAGAVNPMALMVDPTLLETAAEGLVRPFCMKKGRVWLPEAFKARMQDPKLEHTIHAMVILGAMSLKLSRNMPAARFRRPRGIASPDKRAQGT
jgi:hypothetical protein